MKMKPEHFERLKASMLEYHSVHPEFIDNLLSSDLSDKRKRWDWMWKTRVENAPVSLWVARELYGYLDDSHIDTALKRISGLEG